jgi:CTP:molybdopterin cytidylyltransferase MocA
VRLGAVVLAAGAGARLGGVAKALLTRGARTYLESIADAARAVAPTAAVVVVVGPPHGDAVARCARSLGLDVAVNPEPDRGMASSVAIGFAALAAAPADAAWLWPVDHPAVQPATLARVAAALAAVGRPHGEARPAWAQPRFAGRGGHPPLIARPLWSRLAGCAGLAGGARAALAGAPVVAVEVDDPGVVRDADTPTDLADPTLVGEAVTR